MKNNLLKYLFFASLLMALPCLNAGDPGKKVLSFLRKQPGPSVAGITAATMFAHAGLSSEEAERKVVVHKSLTDHESLLSAEEVEDLLKDEPAFPKEIASLVTSYLQLPPYAVKPLAKRADVEMLLLKRFPRVLVGLVLEDIPPQKGMFMPHRASTHSSRLLSRESFNGKQGILFGIADKGPIPALTFLFPRNYNNTPPIQHPVDSDVRAPLLQHRYYDDIRKDFGVDEVCEVPFSALQLSTDGLAVAPNIPRALVRVFGCLSEYGFSAQADTDPTFVDAQEKSALYLGQDLSPVNFAKLYFNLIVLLEHAYPPSSWEGFQNSKDVGAVDDRAAIKLLKNVDKHKIKSILKRIIEDPGENLVPFWTEEESDKWNLGPMHDK